MPRFKSRMQGTLKLRALVAAISRKLVFQAASPRESLAVRLTLRACLICS
jgi:hypothetical protein